MILAVDLFPRCGSPRAHNPGRFVAPYCGVLLVDTGSSLPSEYIKWRCFAVSSRRGKS